MKYLFSIAPEAKPYKGATSNINYIASELAKFNGGWYGTNPNFIEALSKEISTIQFEKTNEATWQLGHYKYSIKEYVVYGTITRINLI